jgi:chromosome segregation protein
MSHFLKKLELNGFKSFAEKTVLEFPAGIVAIVGPNGSGKSNVVDAIRWLLGERDAKNLRGGKGEDLIFAGTQKRARVGQASASLHFENANKFFPVDFEEVVVTREIRRDGQNKYFLNKSEILLRDLIDFFAKARLGSRGLVIIGQGDSDLFVRSTPLERREMIEEILGLREYQLKKADAERRLKNSGINLDKVRALIEEILPHLRSLKRQTGRWERRGELETELRELEDQFFGRQLRELHAKLEEVNAKVKAGEARRREFEAALHQAEAKQKQVESSRPEEQKGLAKIKEEIRALIEKKSTLQKDLGRLEAQMEMAPQTAAAAPKHDSHDVKKLRNLIAKIKEELETVINGGDSYELHTTVETVIEELQWALEAGVESGEGRAESAENTAPEIPEGLRRDLEKLTADLRALDAELKGLREKESGFEKNQESFYQIFKAAVAEVQTAQNALETWERANREQALEKERFDIHREELVRQIEQAGRRVEEFSGERRAESGEEFALPELERKMFRLRGDLAAMGEVDQALVKEARDTEARYEFLKKESEDLNKAVADLTALMAELTEKITSEFEGSLHHINEEFQKFFALMFGGGVAKLKVEKPKSSPHRGEGDSPSEANPEGLSEKEDVAEEEDRSELGVDIEIRLPRKKINSLDMLSGGERSLVGIAALFALVSVSPPPFLVLDEIDAPLDERNARRFAEMLKDFSKRTQFVVVTHNRATMEAADILYGVTLNEDGTSKILSLKLEREETMTSVQ